MTLTPGTRIGAYEIVGPLGAGGMGVVFRARDTKLHREVALKILPHAFASDPERLTRFEREARLLASLNHPNIAQIYGMEELPAESGRQAATEVLGSAGRHGSALVMELVDGDDLSQILTGHGHSAPAAAASSESARGDAAARGGAPRVMNIKDALRIGHQVAAALEAANDAGIVHRDLKPGNIRIRRDMTVKVLDFGLAKVEEAEAAGDAGGTDAGHASTIAASARTGMGVILGTAAYMSPEQARGQAVDRRADIWAFGVVMYEMLTGRRLFTGETVSDLVASVLRQEIDWTRLPAGTPPAVRRLLERCLDRDLTKRLPAIREARLVLEQASVPVVRARALPRWGVAVIVLTLLAASAAVTLWPRLRSTPAIPPTAQRAPRSIAVLPFVNSSGRPEDEYFADGMTDELIAGLGKVPGLHVAARSSAFVFKGQTVEVRDVARRLGVESVLEGTVRRAGSRVRITASLVSAQDGLQIWSNTFENDTSDAFALQDEVTRGVVSGLSLQFGDASLGATRAGRTKDPEAHDLYLRGLAAANAASESDLRRALEFYKQALARDPDFALPYIGIAWVHVFLADAYEPPIEAYPQAKAAALAALAKDSRLADAHALVAYATFQGEWSDPALVDREFKAALAFDPDSSSTLQLVGTYECFMGRLDNSLRYLDRAAEIDPLSPVPAFLTEFCNFMGGRYGAVIQAHKRTQSIDPNFIYLESWVGAAHRELGDYDAALREYAVADRLLGGAPQAGLAITYGRMGQLEKARDTMRRLDNHAATHYVPFAMRAVAHAAAADREGAIRLLQQALEKREAAALRTMRHLREFTALGDDPRARIVFEQVDAMRVSK